MFTFAIGGIITFFICIIIPSLLYPLIKVISKDQQVLCITHQPFLASRGSAHFKVNKNVIDGTTYTSISKLTTKKQRKQELVELIGGGFGELNDYASRLLHRPAA